MNLDLGTLCILGIIVLVAAFILPKLLGGLGGNQYSQRASETPTYDDPDVQSRGGIGRNRSFFGRNRGSERQTYDDPNVQSRGGFGGSKSPSSSSRSSASPRQSGSSGSKARTYDSPKVQSRGGFGGSKPKK